MKKFILVSMCFLVTFISCSKKSASDTAFTRSKQFSPEMKAKGLNSLNEATMVSEEFVMNDSATSKEVPADKIQRKLIKNGSVVLEIESLSQTDLKIQEWIKTYNGYITNSSLNTMNSYYTVKIPKDYFEDAIKSVGSIGKLLNNDIFTNDVTEEYYDTQSHLNTKRILQKKYEDYLSKAKDIKELLQIELELNKVISEIEAMEGRLKRLDSLVDYSTINISCNLPSATTETGIIKPDVKNTFRSLGSAILSFFTKLMFFIIGLIVFGCPIVALIILLYWLLFGKVGVIRKIIKKAVPEKENNTEKA
ncbi:MAG: DUF4349 domain-containing protein [Treponema sp.]|nr:DUF4349 domain-containing protein [Treponema sp.]